MNLKTAYLTGKIPANLDIIDAHAHLGTCKSLFLRKTPLDEAINLSASLGIKKICVSSLAGLAGDLEAGNEEVFKVADAYPDIFYGYVFYNPRNPEQGIREIEKYISHKNFIGVKIHPREHDYGLSGDNYKPLWEYACQEKFIILCHTWQGEVQNDPEVFFPILDRHPELKVLLGHSGGTFDGYESCYRLLKQYPNVYMDLNGFLCSNKWIEQVVEETDEDRLVFSTDQVWNDPRITLGRIVLSDISDVQKEKLLYRNFHKMLGWV